MTNIFKSAYNNGQLLLLYCCWFIGCSERLVAVWNNQSITEKPTILWYLISHLIATAMLSNSTRRWIADDTDHCQCRICIKTISQEKTNNRKFVRKGKDNWEFLYNSVVFVLFFGFNDDICSYWENGSHVAMPAIKGESFFSPSTTVVAG